MACSWLVVASLLSVAFAEFQINFNVQLWVLILMGIAIAVSGYVVFEIALGFMASTEDREKEWLRRPQLASVCSFLSLRSLGTLVHGGLLLLPNPIF